MGIIRILNLKKERPGNKTHKLEDRHKEGMRFERKPNGGECLAKFMKAVVAVV